MGALGVGANQEEVRTEEENEKEEEEEKKKKEQTVRVWLEEGYHLKRL